MKGLILCAGLGTRLRPITYSFPKHLIPILNKPVVQYGVESFIKNGIKEIGFIVNQDYDHFVKRFGDGSAFGAKFTYIQQKIPKGLGHAISCGREFINGDDFVALLGDNFLKDGFTNLISDFKAKDHDAALFLTEVENPTAFGVAIIENNRVTSIEEKPANPKSNMAVVGAYIFRNKIFDIIQKLKPSARGEIEITDAIQQLIEQGGVVNPHIVKGWWRDTGQVLDIIEANRVMLDDILPETATTSRKAQPGAIDSESTISGRVMLGEGVKIINSRLRGPIFIGKNVLIENAFVGPYTVIGDETVLNNCEIEHSVVMSGSKILDLEGRIESSLIGHSVVISKKQVKPKTHQLIVGDNCQIILR